MSYFGNKYEPLSPLETTNRTGLELELSQDSALSAPLMPTVATVERGLAWGGSVTVDSTFA